MLKIEDIVQIYEDPFMISINTTEPVDWETYKYIVQSLAKIGCVYGPKTEPDPEPGPAESVA